MNKDLNTNFCIVGSGPAGSVLAKKLAEKGIQCILVEAGSLDDKHIKQPCFDKINIDKDYQINLNSSYQVGGASNLWSGKMHTLDEIDFIKRPYIKNFTWPFKKIKLISYYKKASKILSLPNKDNFNNFFLSTLKIKKNNTISIKNVYTANKPHNFKYFFKKKNYRLKNLKILTDSKVISLSQDVKNKKISYINIKDKKLNNFKIFAKNFILACGGVEIPRVLLNSKNKNFPLGIGNQHGNVGKYFSTHPKGNLGVAIINKETKFKLHRNKYISKGFLRAGIVLPHKIMIKKKIINHFVEFYPYKEDEYIFKGLQKLKKIKSFFGYKENQKYFHARYQLDQIPNKDNKVFLSKKKDKYGVPLININWKFTKDDQKNLIKFNNHIKEFFKIQNIGTLDFNFEKNKKNFIAIHSHFMGTTRMGSNPKNSVTNDIGKVHGIKNLFISGPSLFPTYGNSNPMLTIIALALKQCDYFLKKDK
jgi:hypothetical protein